MIILSRFKLRPFPSISIPSKTITHNIKNYTEINSKIPLENDGPVIGEEFLPTNSNTKTGVAKILATFPARMDPIANSAKLTSMDVSSDEHKESNKEDHASLRINFDSSHYVNMLKTEGFTDAEANGLIALVSEVVNESMASATKSLVSEFEKKRFLDACLNELKLIKTDVSNLELRDFANLKKNLESIKLDVESSKTNMVSDLARIRAGARLDMNLEKSRYVIRNYKLLIALILCSYVEYRWRPLI